MSVKFILRNKQSQQLGLQFEPNGDWYWIESNEQVEIVSTPAINGLTIEIELGRDEGKSFQSIFSIGVDSSYEVYKQGTFLTSD